MQSSGLYIGGSWKRQYIQLSINLGEIAHKGRLKTHAGENVDRKDRMRGTGEGGADKAEGPKSELMSDVLLADSFE